MSGTPLWHIPTGWIELRCYDSDCEDHDDDDGNVDEVDNDDKYGADNNDND